MLTNTAEKVYKWGVFKAWENMPNWKQPCNDVEYNTRDEAWEAAQRLQSDLKKLGVDNRKCFPRLIEKPTYAEVFNAHRRDNWKGAGAEAAKVAFEADFKFLNWNGHVYYVSVQKDNGIPFIAIEDTGFLYSEI